jgi:DNA ligase-4
MDDSEHLMIVFYDVLLVDDDPVLKKPYSYRRTTMERLVKCIKGTAKLTTRKEIRFASREGPRQLQNLLACAFARQWEGVVLKPMNDPYFRASEKSSHEFASCWIKMKKDYIPGLGDTADFAIVGAGYSAKEAAVKPIPNLRWTHFYVGCLRNKSEVVGFGAKPRFTVVDRVNQSLTSDDLIAVNRLSQFRAMDINSPEVSETFTLDYQSNMSDMAVAFKEPFVFELLGAGFDKLPNQNLFTLRFPRVQKVHWDRDWKDAVSLDELQEMAWQVQSAPGDDDLKDIKAWMHRIDQAERGTKGSMLPWDDSQEQKEARRYSPTGPTKSRRRNKSLVSPPMIRTDTAEMSDKEQRPDRARVAEGFDSEHSSTSGMGNDTPPTSPISSPLPSPAPVKTLGKISPPTPSRPGDRKRPASSEGPDLSRMFKKSKTDVDRTTLKQGEQAPTIPQPLNDVTNSAFPRQSLSSSSTSSKFSLFPEGVTSSNDLLDRGSKRRSESSSLAHDTIDSGNSSHPPASLPKYKSSETMRAIRIPDVSKWTVLLSSCVAELPYSLVIEILHNRSLTQPKTAFRLPSPGYNSGPVLYPESCHDQRLLVLVDESHEEATSEAMKQVIAFMPLWRPAEVQVWDWRFSKVWREEEVEVEEDVHDENDDMMKLPERRLRAKKHFLAKVVPIGEKGGIEIQWRTGNPTRIPPRSLRRR